MEKWLLAFPDLHITWEDFVAEEDKVVSRWRAQGTHLGGFFDTKPTHKEISYSGVTTYRFEKGKIVAIQYDSNMDQVIDAVSGDAKKLVKWLEQLHNGERIPVPIEELSVP